MKTPRWPVVWAIVLFALIALTLLASCTKKACPTYSSIGFSTNIRYI